MGMAVSVSINLCCYNSERYLQETLQSIIAQTYKDWELVIIDDGSTDSTESIIKGYVNRGYPIIHRYQKNHGLGYSRNEALRHSRGEFVAFIDHDDLWMPDKLQRQVSVFKERPEVDFIYSNYLILKNGKTRTAFTREQPEGAVFESFLYRYPVALVTSMLRRDTLVKRRIEFDENIRLSEEYDVFMRLLYGSRAAYIREPLAVYRIHSEMNSIVKMKDYYAETCYILQKFKEIGGCEERFRRALDRQAMNNEYLKAKIMIYQGECKKGREHILLHNPMEMRSILLYFFSFMPVRLRQYLQDVFSKS